MQDTKITYEQHADQLKKSEMAKIHIAKKQLGLDDETYREILQTIAGVESSKDLTPTGRTKVLAHFKSKGFKATKAKTNHFKGRPNNTDTCKQLKKIEALLTVGRKPWAYALKIAKHMYNKDRLEFCHAEELTGIITALSKQQNKG